MGLLNRRRFLCAALGAGSAWGWAASRWGINAPGGTTGIRAHSVGDGLRLHEITLTSQALGSDVSITAHHADVAVAERAIAAAFAEIDRVEDVLSLYRPHSQVCELNRFRCVENAHPYLVEVLSAACDLSNRSDGAFDVTVQTIWSVYAEARKQNRLPEPDEVFVARNKAGWDKIEVVESSIVLNGNGTRITLNGIAQGYATDRAVAVLRAEGIEHALVNAGEMGPLGNKPDGNPWNIGIQHPRRDDAWIALAELNGRCLATSGDYATTFTDDRANHHIFDPRTGRSPETFSSVTVVASTGMEADALSTALFVMSLDDGLRLIRETPRTDALFVFKDGRTVQTDGFPA
jgi:FAD:protein FMN transferase